MNKIILLLSCLAFVFFSCKKDKKDSTPTIPESSIIIKSLTEANLEVPDTLAVPLEITQSSGTKENVTLSVGTLPAHVKAELSSKEGMPQFFSTLTLISEKGAVKGSYPLVITAKGVSGAIKNYTITLNITGNVDGTTGSDSTYMAAVETPQSRNVFIEQFSGASCTNCPDANLVIENILSTHPGRIVMANYFTYNGGSIFKPVNVPGYVSKYDFRDTAATDISEKIYGGVTSIPVAGIDRTLSPGFMLWDKLSWTSETNKRISISSAANITLNSSYNNADNMVTVKVKIAYTKSVNTKNALTVGVTESSIADAQLFMDSASANYIHHHVFRKCLGLSTGNAILDAYSVKDAGRVYECTYQFKPSVSWNLNNCKIFAVLSNNETGNKEVLQATSVNLK